MLRIGVQLFYWTQHKNDLDPLHGTTVYQFILNSTAYDNIFLHKFFGCTVEEDPNNTQESYKSN